jgi:hypothetical protein
MLKEKANSSVISVRTEAEAERVLKFLGTILPIFDSRFFGLG